MKKDHQRLSKKGSLLKQILIILVFLIAFGIASTVVKAIVQSIINPPAATSTLEQTPVNPVNTPTKILITLPHNNSQVYCDSNSINYINSISLKIQSWNNYYSNLINTIKEQNNSCFNKCSGGNVPGCTDICYKFARDKEKYLADPITKIKEENNLLTEAISKYCSQ